MKRAAPLKRTPLRRRTPLRQVSKRRRAENVVRRQVLAELVAARGPWCEAKLHGCSGLADDGHERKRRSQGGDPLNPDEIVLLCRPCHRFASEFPEAAHELGLVVWSWEDAA